jgi:hypothetical protein
MMKADMNTVGLCIINFTVLIVLSQPVSAQESFGRLFSNSAQRSNLNVIRQVKKPVVVNAEPTEPTAEAVPVILPDAVNLQGYVKRNDGKDSTVWINNNAMQENTSNQDIAVGKLSTKSNRLPLKLKGNGKQLSLKAGQVYEPETNKVKEARNHGAQGDAGKISD